ncbi:hypothetical protein PLCT1_01353 [Planctomycetaceae bacterium]|nr:hypothetical protein PLCT1_01353 [Planctomycetaceae bacterium]
MSSMTASTATATKRRILFLSQAFPPLNPIASVRSGNVAKYLTRLGWDVTVVCLDPSLVRPEFREIPAADLERAEGKRIETSIELKFLLHGFLEGRTAGVAGLLSRLGRRLMHELDVDSGLGWVRPALAACRRLQPGTVDLILATGSPFMSFLVAERLARRLRCPYVLDYRDPWTDSPHRESPSPFWVRRLERALLRDAAAATVVSPSWREHLLAIDRSAKVTVVTNGFDPEVLASVPPWDFGGRPAIVYAGTFYPPKRVLAPVLRALVRARQEVPEIELHYFGPSDDLVREEAAAVGAEGAVRCHGRVSQATSLMATKGAKMSVVVTSILPEEKLVDRGIVTGKIFEAFGLRTPVLLVAPEGSDARTVVGSAGAGLSFSGDDISGMADAIVRAGRGESLCGFGGVNAYSWPVIARQLDEALVQALPSTGGGHRGSTTRRPR